MQYFEIESSKKFNSVTGIEVRKQHVSQCWSQFPFWKKPDVGFYSSSFLGQQMLVLIMKSSFSTVLSVCHLFNDSSFQGNASKYRLHFSLFPHLRVSSWCKVVRCCPARHCNEVPCGHRKQLLLGSRAVKQKLLKAYKIGIQLLDM